MEHDDTSPPRLPGDHAPALAGDLAQRWAGQVAFWKTLAAALHDGQTPDVSTAPPPLSEEERALVRNVLNSRGDAGPWRDDLTAILRRIPDRWDRRIWCDVGWYPLVVACHLELVALRPDYMMLQVKEKFGSLRYYFEVPAPELACCTALSTDPITAPGSQAFTEHVDSDLHHQTRAAVQPFVAAVAADTDRMQAVVTDYARLSASVCERCGQPGVLRQRRNWWQTLCNRCATPDHVIDRR